MKHGTIFAKIYIGEEVFEGSGILESLAVRRATYRALVNTMYAFKEIPKELLEYVTRKDLGILPFDLSLPCLGFSDVPWVVIEREKYPRCQFCIEHSFIVAKMPSGSVCRLFPGCASHTIQKIWRWLLSSASLYSTVNFMIDFLIF